MKFEEALHNLRKGEKLRLSGWRNDVFIRLEPLAFGSKNIGIFSYIPEKYKSIHLYDPSMLAVLCNDWEIYSKLRDDDEMIKKMLQEISSVS